MMTIEEYAKWFDGLGLALEQLSAGQYINGKMVGAMPDEGEEIPNGLVTAAGFALNGEVFELLQELGWKYWADKKEMTPERVARIADEYADVLAFLGTLTYYVLARTGLSPADLEAAFVKKFYVNRQRFLGSVDGYSKPAGL